MTHYFDNVQFFADVLDYATRNDHTAMGIERLTGIDHTMARKVWDVQKETLFYQGAMHVVIRLAAYADLSIDRYIKEMTWIQKKKRRASWLSARGLADSPNQGISANSAQGESEAS